MTELLAKAELLCGNFDNCKEAVEEALRHSRSPEAMINILLLDLEARMANNEMKQIVASATRALQLLGVKIPSKVTRRHVVSKVVRVKVMMLNMSHDRILSLPMNTDKIISAAITILTNTCLSALMQDDENHAVYCSFRALELTFQ